MNTQDNLSTYRGVRADETVCFIDTVSFERAWACIPDAVLMQDCTTKEIQTRLENLYSLV